MTMQLVWKEETSVKTHETDFQYKWKPSGFFRAMETAAVNHTTNLHVNFFDLDPFNMAWVISRTKIKFHRFPTSGEKVILHTWPKGIQQKIFFMRDFQFFDAQGKNLADATAAWVLIDKKARKFLPPQALKNKLPENDGRFAMNETLTKIAPLDGLVEKRVEKPAYSHVDMLGHVNNTCYIDWICDCFSMETHASQKLDWLQINFLHEIKPGDPVAVSAGQRSGSDSPWVIHGTNLNTNTNAFEAELSWEDQEAA